MNRNTLAACAAFTLAFLIPMSTFPLSDAQPEVAVSKLARELNQRANAVRSNEAATSFPTNPVAGQFAYRTDLGWVYQRNSANTAWIAMWELDNGPRAPEYFYESSISDSEWVSTTEVAVSPGGGAETEGVDVVVFVNKLGAQNFDVKLNDDADWNGRNARIVHGQGLNQYYIDVLNESDDSQIVRLHYPGEWIELQNVAGGWTPVAWKLNGFKEITADESPWLSTNWWVTRWFCDASGGAFNVTLNDPSNITTIAETPLYYKNVGSSNNVTLTTSGNLINGSTSTHVLTPGDSVTLIPDPAAGVYYTF